MLASPCSRKLKINLPLYPSIIQMIPPEWKVPILQPTPIIKKPKHQFVIIRFIEMIPLRYCRSLNHTQAEPSSCTKFSGTTANSKLLQVRKVCSMRGKCCAPSAFSPVLPFRFFFSQFLLSVFFDFSLDTLQTFSGS